MPRSAHTGRSDAELLDATRSGDTSAFSVLWERHSRAGLVAARHLGNPTNADDVVSEAYLRIMELTLDGRGPRGSFRPYLYRTIQSIAVDHWRRPEDAAENLDVIPDLTEAGPWEDGAFDRNAAARAFASLSERWQSVLWYTEVEGLPPREAAKLIGISPNGVSALAKRAREALQSAWVDEHINRELAEAACQSTLAHLQRYQRGKLTAALSREVEAHLETCDACAGAAAELSGLNRQLALVLAGAVLGGGSVVTFLGGVGSTAPASAVTLVDGASGVTPIDPGSGSAAGSGSSGAAGSGSAAAGSSAGAAAAGAAGGVLGGVSGMVLAAAVAGALVIGGGAIWITNAVQSGSVSTEVAAAAEPAAPSDAAPSSGESTKSTRDSVASTPAKAAQDQRTTPEPAADQQQSSPTRTADGSASAAGSGSASASGNDASAAANASAAASASVAAHGSADGSGAGAGSGSGAGAESGTGSDAHSTGNAHGSGASASSAANSSASSRSTADTRANADTRAEAAAAAAAHARANAASDASSTAAANTAATAAASADANSRGASGNDNASGGTAADSSGDAGSDGAAVDADADSGSGVDADAGIDSGPDAGVSAESSVDAQGTSDASGGADPVEEVIPPVVQSWSLCGTPDQIWISGFSAQSGTMYTLQEIFPGIFVTFWNPFVVLGDTGWSSPAPVYTGYIPSDRSSLMLFVQLLHEDGTWSARIPIDLTQNEAEFVPGCPVP